MVRLFEPVWALNRETASLTTGPIPGIEPAGIEPGATRLIRVSLCRLIEARVPFLPSHEPPGTQQEPVWLDAKPCRNSTDGWGKRGVNPFGLGQDKARPSRQETPRQCRLNDRRWDRKWTKAKTLLVQGCVSRLLRRDARPRMHPS